MLLPAPVGGLVTPLAQARHDPCVGSGVAERLPVRGCIPKRDGPVSAVGTPPSWLLRWPGDLRACRSDITLAQRKGKTYRRRRSRSLVTDPCSMAS